MSETVLLDAAGRRRSSVTMPGYLAGRSPRNKGMSYPADPPRVEEIVVVMRQAGQGRHGLRVCGLVVVLWRAGLRISEALAFTETDVDPRRGSLLVRHGKGDKRREAGKDDWGFEHLSTWLENGSSCRSGRCSASWPARLAGERGQRPPPAVSCEGSPQRLACAAGSRRISSVTLTRWSSHGRAYP
jgi:integrase